MLTVNPRHVMPIPTSPLGTVLLSELSAFCDMGPRANQEQLFKALSFIVGRVSSSVGLPVSLQLVPTLSSRGKTESRYNIVVRMGTGKNVIALGAHYDTVSSTVGADDNASGVITLLYLISLFHKENINPSYSFEFVFFVNEEPPHFSSMTMGSYRYFNHSLPKRHLQLSFFLNIDCIGFFTGQNNKVSLILSEKDTISADIFKAWKAPIGIFGQDESSEALGALSDLRWVIGKKPAVHINDMAISCNPYIHTPLDVPGTLNYDTMADIVVGIYQVLAREFCT
jgi:hypothetical protein